MSEVTGKVRSGISTRVNSLRTFVETEVDLGKKLVNDVVERVNLNENVEPTFAKTVNGGALGQRGNLIKSGVAFVSGTVDNAAKFVQDNAMQNRRLLHR